MSDVTRDTPSTQAGAPGATGAAGAELWAEGLRVAFPGAERPALDGVDLTVGRGEIVSVLGPSGCGKTTLLRVLTGLATPDAGHVALDGRSLDGVAVHRRGIGLMFQDYALFPHRDVGGNVEFGLRMAGWPAAARRARVTEVLDLVGLPGWERRPVGQLSGGERQRVALARALAPAPRLLLLDEPLGALDRTLRDRLVPELGELFRAVGVSVVHVTHDHGEALALADRVVVMDAGRVVGDGTPAALWARPGSAFVARFLGVGSVVPRGAVLPGAVGGEVLVRPGAVRVEVVEVPEQVEHPSPPDRVVAGSTALAATVVRAVFEGERTALTVRLADGTALDLDVPTAAVRWQVGQPVAVHVDPQGVVEL
jgi:thiamine transport system ATP-binding protein